MRYKKIKCLLPTLIILISVQVSIYFLYENHKETYITNIHNNLKQVSIGYTVFLESEVKTVKSFIKTTGDLILSSNLKENNIPPNNIIDRMSLPLNETSILKNLYFIEDETGYSINSKGTKFSNVHNKNIKSRNWYVRACFSDKPVLTEVYKDVHTQKSVITISYALRNETKLLGVLACDIYIEDLYNAFQLITNTTNSKLCVLDSLGTIVLNSDMKMLGTSITASPFGSTPEYDKTAIDLYKNIWNNDMLELYSTKGYYFNDSSIYKVEELDNFDYANYTKSESLNWLVILNADRKIINSHLHNYLFILILLDLFISISIIASMCFILNNIYNKDTLTGVYTKNKLLDNLHKNPCLSKQKLLLFIDINNFTSINSTYGSKIGDKFLHEFAFTLIHHLGGQGILIHSKADDFIFLFNTKDWDYAVKLAEKYFTMFNNLSFKIEEHTIQLHSFMGLIKFNEEQLKNAESSVLTAEDFFNDIKNNNIGKLVIYNDFNMLNKLKKEKEKKLNILMKAIEENRIVPFFQPIYNINTSKVYKYEVLMRIENKEDYLSPFPFIKIAEENNLIETVDLTILKKALIYKKIVDPEDKTQLSINISGKVLNDDEYLKTVLNFVTKYNIKPENISLEITETQSIKNLDTLISIMETYKKMGFKFSIDDFGTGFSSIEYLKQIPADYLKIDGSFIKDINEKKENYYLVQSIVNMAKAFKIKTIAEFVEDEKILNTLKNMDIDYAQGYYIGKPEQYFLQ